MSIWTRIADALAALAKGEGLSTVFDRLRTPPAVSYTHLTLPTNREV